MSILAQALLALIQNSPALISDGITVYQALKKDLSDSDQAAIDAALAQAQASDAASTARADQALDAASKT